MQSSLTDSNPPVSGDVPINGQNRGSTTHQRPRKMKRSHNQIVGSSNENTRLVSSAGDKAPKPETKRRKQSRAERQSGESISGPSTQVLLTEDGPTKGVEQSKSAQPSQASRDLAALTQDLQTNPARQEVWKALGEELMCSICQDIMAATHTIDCGHSFCGFCIGKWRQFKQPTVCPTCRKNFSSMVPSHVIDKTITHMIEYSKALTPEEVQEWKARKEKWSKEGTSLVAQKPLPAATGDAHHNLYQHHHYEEDEDSEDSDIFFPGHISSFFSGLGGLMLISEFLSDRSQMSGSSVPFSFSASVGQGFMEDSDSSDEDGFDRYHAIFGGSFDSGHTALAEGRDRAPRQRTGHRRPRNRGGRGREGRQGNVGASERLSSTRPTDSRSPRAQPPQEPRPTQSGQDSTYCPRHPPDHLPSGTQPQSQAATGTAVHPSSASRTSSGGSRRSSSQVNARLNDTAGRRQGGARSVGRPAGANSSNSGRDDHHRRK